MTITQLAEKHNIDTVAFRLALQEWIDGQPIVGHTYDGWIAAVNKGSIGKFFKDTDYGNMDIPLIALPSLLEE